MKLDNNELPSLVQLEEELHQEKYKRNYIRTLRSTIFYFITVAAVAVLIATLFMPVLRIYGSSMFPTLKEGDLVVSLKGVPYAKNSVIAFYYNNQILVKRAIAFSGDWVDMDDEGNIYVNDILVEASEYVTQTNKESDVEFPHQVSDGQIFVLGDSRENSVDSRSSMIGDISKNQVIGKIIFKIWPLYEVGLVK